MKTKEERKDKAWKKYEKIRDLAWQEYYKKCEKINKEKINIIITKSDRRKTKWQK